MNERSAPGPINSLSFLAFVISVILYGIVYIYFLPENQPYTEGLTTVQVEVRQFFMGAASFCMLAVVPFFVALITAKVPPANRSKSIGNYFLMALIPTWMFALIFIYLQDYSAGRVDDYRVGYIRKSNEVAGFPEVPCPARMDAAISDGLTGVGKTQKGAFCFSSKISPSATSHILDERKSPNDTRSTWSEIEESQILDQYEKFGRFDIAWALLPKVYFLEEIHQGELPKETFTLVYVTITN